VSQSSPPHTPVSVSPIEGSRVGLRSMFSSLGRYVWQTPMSQEPVNYSQPVNQGGGDRPTTVSPTSVTQNVAVRQNASPTEAVSQLSDNQNTSLKQPTVSQNRPAVAVSRNPLYHAPASVAVSESTIRPRGSPLGQVNQVHLTSLIHPTADTPAAPVYVLANPSVTLADTSIMPTYVPSMPVNLPSNSANVVYPVSVATMPATTPVNTVVLKQPACQTMPMVVANGDTQLFPVPVFSSPPEVHGERQLSTGRGKSPPSQSESVATALASKSTAQSVSSDIPKSTVIKPDKCDGTTPLETFIAKFDNTASYCKWSEPDRLYHLKASLTGQAGEVLWGLTSETTEKEIFGLLRNRYENVNQTERFCAELDARRRQPGETVQDVYNDIRKLLALTFPRQSGEMVEFLGRAAFLKALDDPQLTMRVMDQQPITLDDTLATVCRMLSYTVPTTGSGGGPVGNSRNEQKRCHAVGSGSQGTHSTVNNQLQRLERELAEQRRQVSQLQQELNQWRSKPESDTAVYRSHTPSQPLAQSQFYWPSQPTYQPQWANQSSAGTSTSLHQQQQQQQRLPPNQSGRGRVRGCGGGQRNRVDYDTCRLCHGRNHWAWQCPSNP